MIAVVSFDEVPSFKGASTHILSGLRSAIHHREILLITLGKNRLPSIGGLKHLPLEINEPNLLKRALVFQQSVARLLSKYRPDLVHIRSPWEGVAALRSGIPFMYEVNGFPSQELRYHYRNAPESVVARLGEWEAHCIKGARYIITPSEIVRSCICDRFGEHVRSPIMLFPNGYDRPAMATATPFSQGDTLKLVYIGTLSPWQGVSWALRSFTEAPRVSLDIYSPTGGALRRWIDRRITRYGLNHRIRMYDPIDRARLRTTLPRYHAGFAPFLKTTRNTAQGGFPVKILDYLSHGLPVVCSNLRLTKQIVSPASALFFEPNDRLSLASVMNQLSSNPSLLSELAHGVNKDLAAQWTWDEYSEALNELYGALSPVGSRILAQNAKKQLSVA